MRDMTIEDVKPFFVFVKFVVHHSPCHQLGYPIEVLYIALFIHLWWWEWTYIVQYNKLTKYDKMQELII